MNFRAGLLALLSAVTLSGCVSTGPTDPLKTSAGRMEARDAYVQLGIGYLQAGVTEQAKVPLKKALELDPNSADAHGTLAFVFQVEMENDLADQHFRKAIARERSARLLNNYGSFLYEQKQYQRAYELFSEASKDTMYPERSRVFENLGMAASKLGQKDLARKHLERSLRLNQGQPRAALELSYLLYEKQEYVPARKYYELFEKSGQQTAKSLLLGTRIAKIFNDHNTAASLGLQLRRLYPASAEYKQYELER